MSKAVLTYEPKTDGQENGEYNLRRPRKLRRARLGEASCPQPCIFKPQITRASRQLSSCSYTKDRLQG